MTLAHFLGWIGPSLPAAALIVYGYRERSAEIETDAWVLALAAALIAGSSLIYPAWTISLLYGLAYTGALYGAIVVFVLRLQDRIGYRITIATMVMAALTVVVVVPLALLPRLSLAPLMPSPTAENPIELDLDRVSASLESITSSVAETAERAERERGRIDRATEHLLKSLQEKSRQVNELSQEHRRLIGEVERYRQLMRLTKPEVDAISSTLERGKRFNYMMGFFLGLLSSTIVQLATHLRVRKNPGAPPKDPDRES